MNKVEMIIETDRLLELAFAMGYKVQQTREFNYPNLNKFTSAFRAEAGKSANDIPKEKT